ncbi:oleosin 16.4 kDa [Sesamum indicum]|uniref:Oleosin n=1 Tax=Sesamum indicum TaxID=4182 RepID=A0A6I9UC68_SESIN|nr:oleosin 16.4 kDa [Sesamum indicum]
MADRDRPLPHHIQVHHPQQQHRYEDSVKSLLPQNGPSTTQVLAVITLLPIGGSLLGLAGIILVGTLIGLALATPVFVIFSPILVPAVILFAAAVTGFLTSGAFGLTGLSSISWLLNSFRQATGPLDYTKRRLQEAAVAVGDTTKQAGETIKAKAQDEGREGGGGKT